MLLSRRNYFVRERVAVIKLTDTYDILDPDTQAVIGVARDEPPAWAKYARLLLKKSFLPTTINVYETETSPPVLVLEKRPGLLRVKVLVSRSQHQPLGRFESKFFSLGGGFLVYDASGQQIADVKGDWKGWNFKFLDATGRELGVVTKKWAGVGKELFTTADNYVISLANEASGSGDSAALLLAAGLAIDIVFKEQS
jgi:uncharacterized protein YxjI